MELGRVTNEPSRITMELGRVSTDLGSFTAELGKTIAPFYTRSQGAGVQGLVMAKSVLIAKM